MTNKIKVYSINGVIFYFLFILNFWSKLWSRDGDALRQVQERTIRWIVSNDWSLGDGNDMDPNLINQGTGFSVESDDLVTFLLDGKAGSRFESEWWRGAFVSLEPKHCYNSTSSSNYVIVTTFYRCNVFTRIIHLKLYSKRTLLGYF